MGYIYPDSTVDLMFEQAVEAEWEQQNRPTDGETLRQAAQSLGYAIDDLDKTADLVNEACETLCDCVEYDRVKSFLNDMEELLKDMRKLRESWLKEVKA